MSKRLGGIIGCCLSQRSNETGKLVIEDGSSVEFCEATSIGLVPSRQAEDIYPCTDARPTETCGAPVDVSRDFYFYFSPNELCGGCWGGGGYAARLLLLSLPCSADHKRDWPPCKVVFRVGTLNVRNNNNIQRKACQAEKATLRSTYTMMICNPAAHGLLNK